MRKLFLRRWSSEEYQTSRSVYRERLKDFINGDIEKLLHDAEDPRFFEFSHRGTTKKLISSLTSRGHVFSGHQRIAQCLAQHRGEGPLVKENTIITTNLRSI